MKRLLFLVLFFSSLSFAQRVNPSQLRAPTGTASVTQFLTCVPASTCAFSYPGVVINARTGTSYTVVTTDRMKEITQSNAAASAFTLPQAGSAGFTSNFVFALTNIGAGLLTLTPTTSTVNGAATQIVPQNWHSFVYSDDTNYQMPVMPTISAFTNCTDSGGNHLNFTAATGAFSCGTSSSGAGTTINATNNVLPKRSNATTFVDSALTDNGSKIVSSELLEITAGTAALPGLISTTGGTDTGVRIVANAIDLSAGGAARLEVGNTKVYFNVPGCDFGTGNTCLTWGAGVISTTGSANPAFNANAYQTATNCASSGGTCSSAAAGRVSIAAGATTVTVATTAVTANSEIFIQEDSTLGTALSVTCNTTIARSYSITTKTAATSFVITSSAAPITNPACLSYSIMN